MRLYCIGNVTEAKIVTKHLSKGPKTSLEFIFTEKISGRQFKRFIRKMKENGFESSTSDVLFFNTYDNGLIYKANMEGSYFCDFSSKEKKVEEVLIWERQHKETMVDMVDKLETRPLKRLLGEVRHLLEKADISSTKDDKDEDWNSLNSYELIEAKDDI